MLLVFRTKLNDVEKSRETQRFRQQRPKTLTMPVGQPPGGRNPAGSKKPGKKSAQDERRERRENETTKHRWRSFGFQVRGDSASDSRAGIHAAGNSTAGGAGETNRTVGIVDATGAGGGGGSGAGNTTGLVGGGGSAAGSPGSAPQVLVLLCRCCVGLLILLCRGIPGNQYAQHVGMFSSLTCTCI